jgi:hypothetical protein
MAQGLGTSNLIEVDMGAPFLEQLEIIATAPPVTNFPRHRWLNYLVSNLPSLWQLRLHECYLEFDNVWAECQDVGVVLRKRAEDRNSAAGKIVCEPAEAGVAFFGD